jgi:hypothetical protein
VAVAKLSITMSAMDITEENKTVITKDSSNVFSNAQNVSGLNISVYVDVMDWLNFEITY